MAQTKEEGWQGRLVGWQHRQVRSIEMPTLTANIFAAATNRTKIHINILVYEINQFFN